MIYLKTFDKANTQMETQSLVFLFSDLGLIAWFVDINICLVPDSVLLPCLFAWLALILINKLIPEFASKPE